MIRIKSFVMGMFFCVLLTGMSINNSVSVWGEEGKAWSVQKIEDGRVRIIADGTFFAEYRTCYKGTPVIWPICSAEGLLMTRGYPMIEEVKVSEEKSAELRNIFENANLALYAEAKDHPHHRSFWFNHGNVDGCDFWALDKKADIVHNGFLVMEAGKNSALLKTKNNWVNTAAGKTLCTDERTIRFGTLDVQGKKVRYIDFDIVIFASEGDVHFNDTKEGTFGCRIPGTMDLTAKKRNAKQGNSNAAWGGHIINSNGEKDGDTWSKRADWVDYSGPVPCRLNDAKLKDYFAQEDKTQFQMAPAGIILMNHPKSFRYPTWWHVRDYGLFTANPFGQKDFEKGKGDGSILVKKGDTLTFGYRMIFHDGFVSPKVIDQLYKEYADLRK